MTPGERLAAYLAGELDADERRALEAELVRDPALRADLARIRRTDELLAALPDVAPRDGFSERLRERLREELRARPDDELARRRARRDHVRWVPLGAAAAAIAIIASIGVGVGLTGGGDDAGLEATAGGGDAGITMESAPAAADEPVVVAMDGSYTADELATVADQPSVTALAGQGLDELAAADLAAEYAARFGAVDASVSADAATGLTDEDTGAGDAGAEAATEQERADTTAPSVQVLGEASPEELAAVQSCLPQLLADAGIVIPVYAELATFEGEPAIVYGLVSRDPDTGRFTRVEVWAVGRDDCQVRRFVQP